MTRKLIITAGILFLLFALIPAVLYGIRNAGVLVIAAIGVILLALPVFWGKISKNKPLRIIFISMFVAGGIYAAAMSAAMINRAYFNEPPENGELVLIVLGGGIKGDEPSLMLRRRLDAAYDYMMKNGSELCIVTGGRGADQIMPESAVMRKYLIGRGVSPEKILYENRSSNTMQNLEFAAELVPENSKVIIVTDGFHQFRASVFAKAAGLDAPYSISSLTPWGLLPSYWLREMMGVPVALWLAK